MTVHSIDPGLTPARPARFTPLLASVSRQIKIFGLLLAVMMGIYSSALLLSYGFNDDYGLMDQAADYPRQIYLGMATQGRLVFGRMTEFAYTHIHTIADLRWMRAFAILGLACTAWALHWLFLRAGWNRITAICVAIVACTLPTTQVYVTWATFMPTPWGLLFAVLAALLTGWILDGGLARYVLSPIAAALLTVAVTTYQPAITVFVAAMLVDVFSPRLRFLPGPPKIWRFGFTTVLIPDKLWRLAFFQVIYAAALIAGFKAFQWGLQAYPQYRIPGRMGFDWSVLKGKPEWFVKSPLNNALNLWNLRASLTTPLRTSPLIAVFIGVAIMVGLLLFFRGKWWQRSLSLLVCMAALPLAHLPNLLSGESDAYRTLIGLEWTVLFLGLLAISGIWWELLRIFTAMRLARQGRNVSISGAQPVPRVVLVLATAAAAISATYTSTMFMTWPHALELAVLRIQLAKPNVASAHHLIFLQLGHWNDIAAPYWVTDEFGCPSIANAIPWEPQGAVRMIDRETNHNAKDRDIRLENFFQGEYTKPLPPDTAVVDMRRLDAAR